MKGYIKRNRDGVKEIKEGDVMPEWDMSNYGVRHSMSAFDWGCYWEARIKWETAKVISVFPGVYWAFPEEGKIEYELFGMWAVPLGFDISLLYPKLSQSAISRRFERLMWPQDGGYRARRNAKDGGL